MSAEVYVEAGEGVLLPDGGAELIKLAAGAALKFENFTADCEINVTVTDNVEMRELNSRFRGIDDTTDVLSFPALTRDEVSAGSFFSGQTMLGDIAISADMVKTQAAEYGHGEGRELAFLTVHGTLHLLGYDHLNDEEEKIMEDKQEKILNFIGKGRKIDG